MFYGPVPVRGFLLAAYGSPDSEHYRPVERHCKLSQEKSVLLLASFQCHGVKTIGLMEVRQETERIARHG